MDEDLHNPFIEDGIYCLRRASRALQEKMNRDLFYDAAIYYAFGVEKLCKAIIHEVNPVFLLEKDGFENAVMAFYEHRLVERPPLKLVKPARPNLVAFGPTLTRAASFSQAVKELTQNYLVNLV